MQTIILNTIGFSICLLLLLKISRIANDYFTHAFFFTLPWVFVLIYSQVALRGAIKPGQWTIVVLYGANWAYLVAVLIFIDRRNVVYQPYKYEITKNAGLIALLVLIGLQLVSITFELNRYGIDISSAINSDLLEILSDYRLQGYFSAIDLPWFLQIWRWGFVIYIPLAFLLYNKKYLSKAVIIVVLTIALLSTPLKYTRAPILMAMTATLISWIIISRPKRNFLIFAGITILLVSVSSFIFMQTYLIRGDFQIRATLEESMASYFGSAPKSFEFILLGRFPISKGIYSLEGLNFALEKLELISQFPHETRPTIFIPIPSNLYTFLDAYTLDLGLIGAFLGSFLTGGVVTIFYNKVRKDLNLFHLTSYAYLIYASIMAFANNEFIRFSVPLYMGIAFVIGIFIEQKTKVPVSSNEKMSRRFSEIGENG